MIYTVKTVACSPQNLGYTIVNANDVYPYGRALRTYNGSSGPSQYGYQGSEREKELSNNDYYTHFRGLDADIERWKQVDPKMEMQMNFSPYATMNCNPVIFTDPLGDVIHANLKTWAEIWRQARADRAFRQEIISQMFDTRTSTKNLSNGKVHTETYRQHYHYNINTNTNTNIQQAVFANQALSAQNNASNVPASANYYPEQGFNINKVENIRKIGQGDEDSQRNGTKATTVVSDNSYQNGTVNVSFTPNPKDIGGDRLQIMQGNTVIYNQIITPNVNDPGGYNNISIPFNGNRDHIKIKITDNDNRKSSNPGAFDLKATINGF